MAHLHIEDVIHDMDICGSVGQSILIEFRCYFFWVMRATSFTASTLSASLRLCVSSYYIVCVQIDFNKMLIETSNEFV